MSLSALKKELAKMSHDQLVQIIVDAYNARKETKQYFEFFLNPDVETELEKAAEAVAKELRREKWGRSKARVTIFKRLIKNFIGLNPGPEAVLRLMVNTLLSICLAERYVTYTATQEKYAAQLARDIAAWGDKYLLADEAMAQLEGVLRNPNIRVYFRNYLAQSLGL